MAIQLMGLEEEKWKLIANKESLLAAKQEIFALQMSHLFPKMITKAT